MNLFKFRSRSIDISESEPTFKVKYLGNVLTAFVRGDGCVDRPVAILWNNYLANPGSGLDMEMTVSSSGLKAVTKQQGLTDYRFHRIPYCTHNPQYPKLFVWVYRHEGKRMKVESRCHAVLCKTEAKAKDIHAQLRDKLTFALAEFMREKTRRQNSRLVIQRTRSVPTASGSGLPVRTKFLSVGQHFKPSSTQSNTAPRLGAISEDINEPEATAMAHYRSSWQLCALEEWTEGEEELADDCVFSLPTPRSQSHSNCRFSEATQEESVADADLDGEDDFLASLNLDLLEGIPGFGVCFKDTSNRNSSRSSSSGNSSSSLRIPEASSVDIANSNQAQQQLQQQQQPVPTGDGKQREDAELETVVASCAGPDLDDQSVESGFSEQDGQDL